LTYYGIVRQNTGEDWKDVDIILSTSKPARNPVAPKLDTWYLDIMQYRTLSKLSKGEKNTFSAREEMATMEVAADYELAAAPASLPHYDEMNYDIADIVDSGAGSGMGVQFSITGKSDILQDNSIKKLTITFLEFKVEESYVSVPKISEAAFLSIALKNDSEFPLLAGETALFQGQDYIGNGYLDFVAPGQEIDMSMGINDAIKVKRTTVKDLTASSFISGDKVRKTFAYQIEIANNTPREINISVFDQIPISKNDKIDIYGESFDPKPTEKNPNGICEWKLSIPQSEKKSLSLKYSIDYPKNDKIIGL